MEPKRSDNPMFKHYSAVLIPAINIQTYFVASNSTFRIHNGIYKLLVTLKKIRKRQQTQKHCTQPNLCFLFWQTPTAQRRVNWTELIQKLPEEAELPIYPIITLYLNFALAKKLVTPLRVRQNGAETFLQRVQSLTCPGFLGISFHPLFRFYPY